MIRHELEKNIRILFRKKSSLLLLILGPLFLILLIGFAFSGNDIHDVHIGMINPNMQVIEPALANFSSFAEISYYDSVDMCKEQLEEQEMHLCILFSDSFIETDGFPSGTLTLYYDNSRKALSEKIVTSISDFFGLEAQKLSILSTETAFSQIQTMVTYLYEKNTDIDVVIEEANSIKESLIQKNDTLTQVANEFDPLYNQSLVLRVQIQNLSSQINTTYEIQKEVFDNFNFSLSLFQASLGTVVEYSQNLTVLNTSLSQIQNETPPTLQYSYDLLLQESVERLTSSIDTYQQTTDEYYSLSVEFKQEFDAAMNLIDTIHLLIIEDLKATSQFIVQIDESVDQMKFIQGELTSNLEQLEQLDPSLAEKIIKPILQITQPILPDINNVAIAFPSMLALVVIFISSLFANIVTVSEINAHAFYRNLLAPVNKHIFILGLFITNICVVLFQVLVLLLVAYLQFNIDIFAVFFPVLGVSILLSMIFVSIGTLIAILLREGQTSVLTTTFIVLGFFLFSNALVPLEIMPPLASVIASYNPFVLSSLAFQKMIIFQNISWSMELSLLVGYFILAAASTYVVVEKKLRA